MRRGKANATEKLQPGGHRVRKSDSTEILSNGFKRCTLNTIAERNMKRLCCTYGGTFKKFMHLFKKKSINLKTNDITFIHSLFPVRSRRQTELVTRRARAWPIVPPAPSAFTVSNANLMSADIF